MTQEDPAVMTARSVPGLRQMDEVACVMREHSPVGLGGHTQLKFIGLAKMACISYRQAIDPMLGKNCCERDGYGFIQIEFHGRAGGIC